MFIAYSSQSNRRKFINEVIEEEDEGINKDKDKDKDKDNETKKERYKNRHNPEKFRKIVNKNNKTDNLTQEPIIIWSNTSNSSQLNKKTYENLFYKKTFDKYEPIREKLINNNKSNNVLPDLQKQNYNINNLRSKSIEKSNQIQNINKNKNTNNINHINSITNDTSAFTHSSKKYFSPKGIYTQNYSEDLSKFRMGLLSAGSSSNNNIIIPMMPMLRPASNFNFGGGQLWNNLEKNNLDEKNEDINMNNNNINMNNNIEEKDEIYNNNININKENNEEIDNNNNKEIKIDLINNKKNYNVYNKTNSATRNKQIPFKHTEMKKRLELFKSKNDINNLYLGMDKMITKLHKIKIEKGMMNSGIVNSLNQKLNNDYQNQIEQFKKSHLPMIFNSQNNKLRSHSFNNKNKFY